MGFQMEKSKDWLAVLDKYEDIGNGNVKIDGVVKNVLGEGQNSLVQEMYADDLSRLPQGEVIMSAMLWETIYNDEWMWFPVWGVQRGGKTTFQLQTGYKAMFSHTRTTEQNWEMVLDAVVANLSGLLYKLEHKKPFTVRTSNKLHERVPYLIWDDWGGESNKSETRAKEEWDMFKGFFDMIGTQLAILSGSMVNPEEPTAQLVHKYTHEVFIPRKMVYKLDKIVWKQNYHGHNALFGKVWIETETFTHVPLWVYKRYDEMRMSRVDEMKTKIRDTQFKNVDTILKRMNAADYRLLLMIKEKGPLTRANWVKNENLRDAPGMKDAMLNCRGRDLIIAIRQPGSGSYYHYDITDLGLEVLTKHKSTTGEPNQAKDDLDMLQ